MPNRTKHIIYCVLLFVGSLQLLAQEPIYERHFEDDFKSRYSSRKYNYEGDVEVKDELVNRDGTFSKYENETPKEREENNSTVTSFGNDFLTWVFIIILIIAVVFIIYNVMNEGQTSLFSRGKFRKINTKEITIETIDQTDIQALIHSAEAQGDYRLAIRYYYLLVLKSLSIKNIIKYEEDKTDSDYLGEMGQHTYSTSFAKTAYLYNYVWYGEFLINQQQYGKAKNNFETFLTSLGR